MSQNDINFLKLIREHQMMAGISGKEKLTDSALPDPSSFGNPTITLQRQLVERFRNNYALLINYAALKCDKDPKELCLLDLLISLDINPFPVTEDDEFV